MITVGIGFINGAGLSFQYAIIKVGFLKMNLDKKITKQLNKEVIQLLELARYTAAECGFNIYLVGGLVRDLLLETHSVDIDIVVEGNAIDFAQKLTDNSKITVHPDFGTATIKLNRLHVDLVTARSERYSAPGALPEVIPGDIIADLYRRDFTINAMAVSLNPANYGELIDPYKGYTDLENKLVRIIHDNSFTDDATRIWRAIRYEQRLNFKIEQNTLKLLMDNVDRLDAISGDRIRHELELALKEKMPEKVLMRAYQLNVLAKINPSLEFSDRVADWFIEAHELGLSDSTLAIVYFVLLFYSLTAQDLDAVISRLHFNRTTVKVLSDSTELKNIMPKLNMNSISASDIYFLLSGYSQPAIIAGSITAESLAIEENIDTFLTRLKNVKPRLNGNDLKKLGITNGPEIKRVLRMLLAARLDGKVTTKQGEIRLVYAWMGLNPNGNLK